MRAAPSRRASRGRGGRCAAQTGRGSARHENACCCRPCQRARLQLDQALGGEANHVAQNIRTGGLHDERGSPWRSGEKMTTTPVHTPNLPGGRPPSSQRHFRVGGKSSRRTELQNGQKLGTRSAVPRYVRKKGKPHEASGQKNPLAIDGIVKTQQSCKLSFRKSSHQ